MFFITMLEKLEQNGVDFPYFGATRCVGFVPNYGRAQRILHENSLDVREFLYDYAVVEMFEDGIYPCCPVEQRQFFQWDENKNGYVEIEPDFIENFINIAIG